MAKDVTKTAVNLPATTLPDLEQFAGAGFDEANARDYAIPTLSIIQKMSPVLDETSAIYNPDAKAGMLYNNVMNCVYDRGTIAVIPVYFKTEIVEWVPRDMGGGFVGIHAANAPIIQSAHRTEKSPHAVLPNGNLLVQTARHFCIAMPVDNSGDAFQTVISMTSTQLKKSRKWLSLMATKMLSRPNGTKYQAPSFAYTYLLDTILEKNEKGSWYSWQIVPWGTTPTDLIEQAILFYNNLRSGPQVIQHDMDDIMSQEEAMAGDIPF